MIDDVFLIISRWKRRGMKKTSASETVTEVTDAMKNNNRKYWLLVIYNQSFYDKKQTEFVIQFIKFACCNFIRLVATIPQVS